jgi:hypothetical protein
LFLFDGGTLGRQETDRITLPADELSEYRFLHLSEVPKILIDRLARRVVAAAAARQHRTTTYLERGASEPPI